MNAAGGVMAMVTAIAAPAAAPNSNSGGAAAGGILGGGLSRAAHGRAEFASTLIESIAPAAKAGTLSTAHSTATASPGVPGRSASGQIGQTLQTIQTRQTRQTRQRTDEEAPLSEGDLPASEAASGSGIPVVKAAIPESASDSASGRATPAEADTSSALTEPEEGSTRLQSAAKGVLPANSRQFNDQEIGDGRIEQTGPQFGSFALLASVTPNPAHPELSDSSARLSAAAPTAHRKEEAKPGSAAALAPVAAAIAPPAPPDAAVAMPTLSIVPATVPTARPVSFHAGPIVPQPSLSATPGASAPRIAPPEGRKEAGGSLAAGVPDGGKEGRVPGPADAADAQGRGESAPAVGAGFGANPAEAEEPIGFDLVLSDKGNSGGEFQDRLATPAAEAAAPRTAAAKLDPRSIPGRGLDAVSSSAPPSSRSAPSSPSARSLDAPSPLAPGLAGAGGSTEDVKPLGTVRVAGSARAASMVSSGKPGVSGSLVASGSVPAGATLAQPSGEAARSGTAAGASGQGAEFTAGDLLTRMDSAAAVPAAHLPAPSVAVGIDDPAHGWIEVRAEGTAGQVTASLAAASPEAHAALHAQLPAMAQYLAERDLGVRSVAVSGGAGAEHSGGLLGRDSGGGSSGGSGGGSGGGFGGHGGAGSFSGTPGDPDKGAHSGADRAPLRVLAAASLRAEVRQGGASSSAAALGDSAASGGRLISVQA